MRRSIPRRSFLAGITALPLIDARPQSGPEPRALRADEGELVHVGRTQDPVHIKVSPRPGPGRFAMITQDMAPGSIVPVHLHGREDEIIFIQAGEGVATLGDQRIELKAGSTLYVPQGTWHGGENTGTSVLKWVAIYSPSGFEGYFREIAIVPGTGAPRSRSDAEWKALDMKYAIRYPGR
jgi:quercetin dioxygenase-like cupin family protein